MRKMKRMLAYLFCAVMLLGALTACGQSTESATAPVSTGSSAETTPAAGTTDKDEEVVFTFSQSEDLSCMDGTVSNNTVMHTINALIYDNLIYRDHIGNYSEGLWTDWVQSEDGLDWTITLRENVKFQNGEDFNAESMKTTFERLATDETLASHATWGILNEVEIIDDYHCVFHFSEPFGSFVYSASSVNAIAPKAFAELGSDYWNYAYGCGPYKFITWDPGNEVVLERWDGYWNYDSSSNVDKIVYKPISEDTTRVSALQTGEIDLIVDVPFEQTENLKATAGISVQSQPGQTGAWLGLNCGDGKVFNDINARLALTHCIDRALICNSVLGTGTPVYQIVCEGVTGYDPNISDEYNKYDLDLAKEYLAQSNYNGEKITFIVPNGKLPRINEIVLAIQSMMQECGFNVDLQILEQASYSDLRSSGAYDMHISNVPFSGDSIDFAHVHVVRNVSQANCDSQVIIDLINAAKAAPTDAQRSELLAQAYEEICKNGGPLLMLFFFDNTVASWDNITNFTAYPDSACDFSKLVKN